jgi:hypothetical protein
MGMIYLFLKDFNFQFLLPILVMLAFVFGWLEDKVGLCREEMELHSNRMGIQEQLDRIEGRLDETIKKTS